MENDYISDFIISHQIEMKNREFISKSDEYIKWLNRFSSIHPEFSSDSWDYSDEQLEITDASKVKLLNSFYSVIENYANDNYFYPVSSDFGCFYRVKFEDARYEVGVMAGQGVVFYIKRVNEDENYFLDFSDILLGKKQSDVDFINKKLSDLSDMVREIYNNGVPIFAIKDMLNSLVNELETKNDSVLSKTFKGISTK